MRDRGKMLLTLEELREYDGRSGKPVYVAFKGKIYDVSESPLWKTGKHQGLHSAGSDLTEEIANAPHAEEVLVKFPVVGEVKQEDPPRRTFADSGINGNGDSEKWEEGGQHAPFRFKGLL